MIFDENLPPQHSLNANIYTIKMLTRRPGSPYFTLWFMVSTFTPIMSACVGPLANMISIGAIVDPWRNDPSGSHKIPDSGWVLGLNIASLIIGFAANILLVLNFTGKLRYAIAQVGSTALWLMASIVLSATLIAAWCTGYFDGYERSGGFYLGCFTSGLYFVCFCLLAVNYGGYLLGEYDATFNLDQSQRGLMIHTVMLGAWLCIGPGMFMHLVSSGPWDSYATSLYYTIILVTTIGLGDVLPKNNAGRALSLAYAFFGVLELGLIISWLRQFVLSNIGPTLFWHRLEQSRQKAKRALEEHNVILNGRQSFELISRLRSRCEIIQKLRSVFFTLGFYTIFWLMGALVFTYVEDWTYFISVYFAFLCLITIGFGDFAPETALGRAFFVVWSLSAVPMMTMLITSVGDAMFAIASHMDEFLSSVTGLKQQFYVAEDAMIEAHWFKRELDTARDEEEALEGLSRIYTPNGKIRQSLHRHLPKPHLQSRRSSKNYYKNYKNRHHNNNNNNNNNTRESHHTLREAVPEILRALSPGRTLRAISSIVSEDRIREDIEEEQREEQALRKEEHMRVHGRGSRSRNNSVLVGGDQIGRNERNQEEVEVEVEGDDNEGRGDNEEEVEEEEEEEDNEDNDENGNESLDRIQSQASPGTGGVGNHSGGDGGNDSSSSSDSEERMILNHIVMDAEEYRRESVRIVDMLLASINNDPNKVHSFEEWAAMYYLLGEDPMEPMLFLSDHSPLRFPLKEGNYMMNRVMRDLENRVDLSDEPVSLQLGGDSRAGSIRRRRPRSIVRSSRASQVSIHARDRSQSPRQVLEAEKPSSPVTRVSSSSPSSSSTSSSSSSSSSSNSSSSSSTSSSQRPESCPHCSGTCTCGCRLSSSAAGVPPHSTS